MAIVGNYGPGRGSGATSPRDQSIRFSADPVRDDHRGGCPVTTLVILSARG